jgi:hypothetical protein
VALRSKERLVLADYLKLIKDALNANIGLCLWLIETFSNQHFIKEFFLDCPVHDLARFVQGILRTAMERIYTFEWEGIKNFLACYSTQDGPLGWTEELLGPFIEHKFVDVDCRTASRVNGPFSNCGKARIYRVKNNDCRKFPKLLIFINSYIHMSCSSHILAKMKMTG